MGCSGFICLVWLNRISCLPARGSSTEDECGQMLALEF